MPRVNHSSFYFDHMEMITEVELAVMPIYSSANRVHVESIK